MPASSEHAPGALDLIRQFENTVDLVDGSDRLDGLVAASQWCLSHGLPPVTNSASLERLRSFREALRDVLFANNHETDYRAAWEGLRPFVSSVRLDLTVDPERGLGLRPARDGSESAIASLLAVVYEALVDGTWSRLRACRKASCRFAYYDHTKNRSRAWCSMASCGNQAKAQRRRQRERGVSP
ncbi:MAG TPA: CGNR zinc finger domain-containing protein [Candidatus Cybelea sp.]|jgi:predicted RNA-binding Zn ribbon-like protein|nr:CGNR zinc finger domain-containing protein [Candidatus Cybelea sp.]